MLSAADEAIVVAFRRHTLLPLDDCLYALQATIPHLTHPPLLRRHLDDFVSAYNFARRLKTLKDLTPYEYICSVWTGDPKRSRLDPTHQLPGLNT